MSAPVLDRRSSGWADLAQRPLGPSRGWRPALRLARRDLRRHPGRTAAAAVMILVPVMLASALAVVLAMLDVSQQERTLARMGAADVLLEPYEFQTSSRSWTDAEVEALVGAPVLRVVEGTVAAAGDSGPFVASTLVVDFADPRADGLAEVLEGRLPSTGSQVAVSPGLLARTGSSVGGTTTVDGTELTISGVAVRPWSDADDDVLFALPASVAVDEAEPYWLADPQDPVDTGLRGGLDVQGRGQLATSWGSRFDDLTTVDGTTLLVLTVGTTLVVLEIALLAGPAFAVGVRQQQQTLALLAATGGDSRALRRVVLTQALLVGAVAAGAGALIGSSVTVVALALARYRAPFEVGPLQVPWGFVLLFVAIGVVAAVAAALVPAVAASRSTVVGALAVRPTSRRLPRRRPLAGALLLAVGSAMLWSATTERLDALFMASLGVLALGFGMVLIVPLPVALMARATTGLPLAVRLAGRESSRSAARSVAAVAAVAGASASLVTALVVTAAVSAEEQTRYVPQTLPGVTTLRLSDPTDLAPAQQEAADLLPGARTGVVGAAGGPAFLLEGSQDVYSSTELFVPTPGCPELQPRTSDVCRSAWTDGEQHTGATTVLLGADAAVLSGYDLTEAQLQVLTDGGVLLADWSPALTPAGTVELEAITTSWDSATGRDEQTAHTTATVPVARYAPSDGQAVMVVSEGAARALDIWTPVELLVRTTPGPVDVADTAARASALTDAAPLHGAFGAGTGVQAEAYTEVGFQDRWSVVQMAAVAAAAVVLLGATFTATALALADARRDRAVMTAMGASPRTQRSAAGSTAALIAGTGAVVGAVVGLVPGLLIGDAILQPGVLPYGLDTSDGSRDAFAVLLGVVPWGWVAVFVLGLPVLAGLVVAALAKGRPDAEAARMSARTA